MNLVDHKDPEHIAAAQDDSWLDEPWWQAWAERLRTPARIALHAGLGALAADGLGFFDLAAWQHACVAAIAALIAWGYQVTADPQEG